MKTKRFVFTAVIITVIITMLMGACNPFLHEDGLGIIGGGGGGGGSGGSNPFIGTWSDGSLTVTCTDTTWMARDPFINFTGSYTRIGNTATFSETNGSTFGTATVSGNTMTVKSTNYGTYNLTKR